MNPLVLAVDTTHESGSLAITRGGDLVEELALHAPGGFAHVIYGHLKSLLDTNGLRMSEMDCFAAASGPGSFTGVRVGLACVKGLAEACRKPAVAVSNLRALASYGTTPLRAVLLDARRGEIYAALYNSSGEAVLPETVASLPAWLRTLPERELEFIAHDFEPFAADLAAAGFASAPRVTAPRALAGAMARIACQRFLRGEALDAAALDANYVRRSDAELFWKES